MIGLLERAHGPVVLALNKVDLIHKPRLLPLIEHYTKAFAFRAIVPISARTGDGVAALEHEILAALPEGEPLYPDDYLTDQTRAPPHCRAHPREGARRTRTTSCRTRRPS